MCTVPTHHTHYRSIYIKKQSVIRPDLHATRTMTSIFSVIVRRRVRKTCLRCSNVDLLHRSWAARACATAAFTSSYTVSERDKKLLFSRWQTCVHCLDPCDVPDAQVWLPAGFLCCMFMTLFCSDVFLRCNIGTCGLKHGRYCIALHG